MNKYNNKIILHFIVLALLFSAVMLQAQGSGPKAAANIASTLQNVDGLNKAQKYDAALQILLHELTKHPENESLKASFKKTFALHIYHEVSTGFQRIAVNKHDVEAYIAIARAYNLMGDHFRAMEILTEGIIDNSESSGLWMVIGVMEMQSKRDGEALSVFREVIRIDSRNGHAHNNSAYLLVRSHDLSQALTHAQAAVNLEPNNPNFIDTLAEVRFQMGERGEALALIKRAIHLAPNEEFFKDQLTRFETTIPRSFDTSAIFEASDASHETLAK